MADVSYAFATVEDYEARYGEVDAVRLPMVEAALGDAGLMLRRYVEVDEADEMQAALLKTVSLSMVKRAMATADSDVYGATETTAQMGPFQQSIRWSNPSGDLFISSAEKDLLGIGSTWVASIPARIEGFYGSNAEL